MQYLVIACAAVVAAIFTPRYLPSRLGEGRRRVANVAFRAAFLLVAAGGVLTTSIVSIPANEVGVVRRVYGVTNLPDGRLIATQGETGYQAQIIPPGTFRISPFFTVFNEVLRLPVVVVPSGYYGRVVANDGAPLVGTQIMADAWPDDEFLKYLDAEYFLTHGGQKGLQLSVLKPGVYPLNLALFQVKIGYNPAAGDPTVAARRLFANTQETYDIRGLTKEIVQGGQNSDIPRLDTTITSIPAGFVGVVRSSVRKKGIDCTPIAAKAEEGGVRAELVPPDCRGVWSESLPPNDYYLNRDAYDVTLMPTRVTELEFRGGYERRYIDLKVDSRGDFIQTERLVSFPTRSDAVDAAVGVKIEGWEIPQELRALVQIAPEKAPIVVAAVGGQAEVAQRIVVPSIRSAVRAVYGGTITVPQTDAKGVTTTVTRPTRVSDTIENRPILEEAILRRAQDDGRRAGVDIKEIRLGDTAIPPELLLARQREQLAGQLKDAYKQEQIAQEQRQQTEQARATADRQRDIVAAEIAVKTARLEEERKQAEGHAERLFLEELAAGQTAQANVLGKESVLRLQEVKLVLDLLGQHPELVANLKLPQVFVAGGQGGLEGAAAVFGSVARSEAASPNK
jgi:hypothetical protein